MRAVTAALLLTACFASAPALATLTDNLLPEVQGAAVVGERLSCSSGSWNSTEGSPTFTYSWVRAGVPVGSGVTYFYTAADVGHELWCVVTATRGGEQVEVASSNALGTEEHAPPPPAPPVNVTPPAVTGGSGGAASTGTSLTCTQGSWSGSAPIAYAYRWLRDGEAISGATSATYKVAEPDQGHALACAVAAENRAGNATATSGNQVRVAGEPPSGGVPSLAGTPEAGQKLTCSAGEWSGSKPITYSYTWLRSGKALPLESSRFYVVGEADEGQTLACKVRAENTQGHAESASAPVSVTRRRPEALEAPVVSGAAEVGAVLNCSHGSWKGAPSEFEYEWLRGSTLVSGPSASSTYHVVAADAGHPLFCEVSAVSSGGIGEALSSPFVIPEAAGPAPAETAAPSISGTAQPGHQLLCTEGQWENSPSAYFYEWVRDAGSGRGVPIETGADSYTVTAADEGHAISCRVSAVNRFGSAEAESVQLWVSGQRPAPTSQATVEGDPVAGESMSCLRGSWTGAPEPVFSYRWMRDGAPVAEGLSYVVTQADRGHELSCLVSARNSEGEADQETAAVYVPGFAPEGPAPRIEGTGEVGSVLSCEPGAWTGAPAPGFLFQWSIDGVAIPGETGPTYGVPLSAKGYEVTCTVTGSSREGSMKITSVGLRVAGLKPVEVSAPAVTGSPVPGLALTCARGVWKGAPPPGFAYRWLRDGAPIPQAGRETYTVQVADSGHTLSCVVTATNLEGSAEAESENRVTVEALSAAAKPAGTITVGTIGVLSEKVIQASLSREILNAEHGLKLSLVRRARGFSFPFTAPAAGTLELLWYHAVQVKIAGTRHTRTALTLLGRARVAFNGGVRHSVHLTLTAKGRSMLRSAKTIHVWVKALFKMRPRTVSWTTKLALGG